MPKTKRQALPPALRDILDSGGSGKKARRLVGFEDAEEREKKAKKSSIGYSKQPLLIVT